MRSTADSSADRTVPAAPRGADDILRPHLAPRWAGPLFLFLAVALVPWIVYLALSLPAHTQFSHYRTAWVGFDVLLFASLGRTAWLAIKGRRQMEFSAVVSATLLVVDAWFDVTTSKGGGAEMFAIFLAVCVELPTAFLALYLSRRVEQVVDLTIQEAVERRGRLQSRLRRQFDGVNQAEEEAIG